MTNIKTVTGCTTYKGFLAQQHEDIFQIFEQFLIDTQPKRILEIGTAGGGLTLFLRHTLNKIGLETSHIKSLEINEMPWYDSLRAENIEIRIENVFDHPYLKLEKPELVVPFIQEEGVTLVLCDGGHKKCEFTELAKHLKVGDFIMAHDYIDTVTNFLENYMEKIWNWREIGDEHIEKSCTENNLIAYRKDLFDSVVWVCKKKVDTIFE